MKDFINHSGGAAGADSAWDRIGREFGVVNHKHYYAASQGKTPLGNVALSDEELSEADVFLEKANVSLKRTWPTSKPYVNGLLRRNYFQVKNSKMVAAVGMIDDNWVLEGGTAWAGQMAIDMGKPVYVFCQRRLAWFFWNRNALSWGEASGAPVLTDSFAGVGTRKLEDPGEGAIRNAYTRTARQWHTNKLAETFRQSFGKRRPTSGEGQWKLEAEAEKMAREYVIAEAVPAEAFPLKFDEGGVIYEVERSGHVTVSMGYKTQASGDSFI